MTTQTHTTQTHTTQTHTSQTHTAKATQSQIENETPVMTAEQLEAFGSELDEIRQRIIADLGDADRDYIYNVVKAQRAFEVAGRGLLQIGFLPPAWVAGVAALSIY